MKQVYLVDDDNDICRLAGLAFDALSENRLTSFGSAGELRAAIRTQMPDLLLLDVMMPEQTGPELLHELRDEYGESLADVAFLTAKNEADEVAELAALGVAGVLSKPFSPRQLVTDVESLLAAR